MRTRSEFMEFMDNNDIIEIKCEHYGHSKAILTIAAMDELNDDIINIVVDFVCFMFTYKVTKQLKNTRIEYIVEGYTD